MSSTPEFQNLGDNVMYDCEDSSMIDVETYKFETNSGGIFTLEKIHNREDWDKCVVLFKFVENFFSKGGPYFFGIEPDDLLTRKIQVYFNNCHHCDWDIFMFACFSENIEAIEILLNTGRYDINETYLFGDSKTPLHIVIGNPKILKLFIDTGKANLNITGSFGETPFSEACYFGYIESCFMMYETGQCKLDDKYWSSEETLGHKLLKNILDKEHLISKKGRNNKLTDGIHTLYITGGESARTYLNRNDDFHETEYEITYNQDDLAEFCTIANNDQGLIA